MGGLQTLHLENVCSPSGLAKWGLQHGLNVWCLGWRFLAVGDGAEGTNCCHNNISNTEMKLLGLDTESVQHFGAGAEMCYLEALSRSMAHGNHQT